ncbi:MAG TPA: hypothetical protein DCL86_12980 [Bacteroidales bacterium]|jgi:hypothetical protein|nr:hypothetical protein [Bacteroidales bacterium]
MIDPLNIFLKKLLMLSAGVAFFILIFYFAYHGKWFSPALPFLLIFFMAITLLSYYFIQKSAMRNPRRFIQVYLITTAARLILYIVIIMLYVFLYRDDALYFLSAFFTLYVTYSVFEVMVLAKKRL